MDVTTIRADRSTIHRPAGIHGPAGVYCK